MSSEPITPATYSGVHVLQQADSYGQPVMRRAKDDYINATQILRAAGFPKTQRTKILERDISGGVHEKVQGGFHMFQGTWVPLETGVKLARKHGVEELLAPLFEFVLTDGLHSDIFKNMGKFGKPYRGPVRPRVEARPASQRLASTSVAALIFDDSSEDDEDPGALDFDDDDENEENEDDDDARNRRLTRAAVVPASGEPEQSASNNNTSSSDDNGETPPPADRKLNPSGASSSNLTASFTPQPIRKQAIPPSPKSTPTHLPVPSGASTTLPPGSQSPIIKRGPGRPKGSKNRTSSASPAPQSPRTSARRLESLSPEKDTRGGAYQPSSRSGSVNGASSRREPRSSRLKESAMRQSMTVGRGDDEMEGLDCQDAVTAAETLRRRKVDDVRDLMDPYGLLRRRRGSLSSTMEGEHGDDDDPQRWDDEDVVRSWDDMALGLFAPAVAADEEEEETRGRSRVVRIGGATIPTTDEAWGSSSADEASAGLRFGRASSALKMRPALVSEMEGDGYHTRQKLMGGIRFKRAFACGVCGVLTKRHALWKRRIGSGGSRSVAHIRILCNSCGLKACFGRSPKDFENAVLDDGSDDEDPEDGEISWKRGAMASEDLEEEGGTVGSVSPEEQELRRLKKVLDRRLRYSKRLKGLLEALRKEDASVDRGFRRAVVWCRQVKQGTFCQKEEEERDVVNVHGVDEVGWGQQVLNKFVRAVTTSRT